MFDGGLLGAVLVSKGELGRSRGGIGSVLGKFLNGVTASKLHMLFDAQVHTHSPDDEFLKNAMQHARNPKTTLSAARSTAVGTLTVRSQERKLANQ